MRQYVTSRFKFSSSPTRLREKALRAGLWTLGAHGFDLALSMISNLIMTRLLFPEAFGLVAAATAPIAGLALVSDFGVHTVIIQSSRGDEADFLRSGWVFQLWRGIMMWAVLAIFCLVISLRVVRDQLPTESVYAHQSFPLVTAVMGFGLVLGSAESTALFLNLRRLNQAPIVILGILSRILTLPITIAWAFAMPSVWALVGGGLIGGVVRLVLSHTIVPGPSMALRWKKDHLQEIVHFGKWIAVSSLASFVVMQSDVILFGFLFPAATLGVYSIAKSLINVAEGVLDRLNGSLALPILGEVIRTNPGNLRDRYYRFRLPIDLIAAGFSGALLVTGSLIVGILYDPRYAEAGSMLQILAIGTTIYSFQLIRSAFTGTGDPHIVASVTIIQAISMIVCISAGYVTFGKFGAIAGVAVHRLVPSLVIVVLAQRRNWISVWQELRIVPIFVLGVILGEASLRLSQILGITAIGHLWR